MRRIVLMLLLFLNLAYCQLWMPSIFGSGMVLQGGRPVIVWGKANAGDEVTLRFAKQMIMTTADHEGRWKLVLDPMETESKGSVMNVLARSGSQSRALEFNDVLVGEVWVTAGQSNMGWPLSKCEGGEEAAANADYSWLHIFTQWPYQGACDEPAQDVKGGAWGVCTPENAAKLSGVGFFFARELQKRLTGNTPIALVNTAMGGTYAECWIDADTLKKTPSSQPFLNKASREIERGIPDAQGYWGEQNFRRPSALYNGKVAPIQPFAVAGVLWYQGEGNSQKWLSGGYEQTLTALIKSWRIGWKRDDLPLFIVQLPRFDAGEGNDWPAVRAAQSAVAGRLENVELAVTIDLGSKDQIHPPDKEPVGRRLALLAAEKVYGKKVSSKSVMFRSLRIEGHCVVVCFDNADGLHFKDDKAKGFEICGDDGVFVPAFAEIVAGGVRVSSERVRFPAAVRYGWFNWGEANLCNADAMPTAPFSTAVDRKN
jgi:sialate O-acetylesterase